jgi:DnaJ-class molecular chaperone
MRSPYAVLGVSQAARDDDIKSAYRKLAKLWHPDQNHADPRAKDVFAEINNAYQLLSDQPRRKLFDTGKIDASGRRKKKRTIVNTGFNPFAKAKDIFTTPSETNEAPAKTDKNPDELKPKDAAQSRSKPQVKKPSQPQQAFKRELGQEGDFDGLVNEIFGSEAERLAAKKLAKFKSQRANAKLDRRQNKNTQQTPSFHDEAMSVLDDAFTKFEKQRATSTTRAPDRLYQLEIDLVDIFTGTTLPVQPGNKNSLNIYIPAGTPDGGQVVIEKMGGCRKGEIPGDIIVTVKYKSNQQFWMLNGELHTNLAVDLADAVLGGEVTAQSPEGPVSFMLPDWTSSNHVIRIPKRGLPNLVGERGDLCANVCILLPEKPNNALKDVLKKTRKTWFM